MDGHVDRASLVACGYSSQVNWGYYVPAPTAQPAWNFYYNQAALQQAPHPQACVMAASMFASSGRMEALLPPGRFEPEVTMEATRALQPLVPPGRFEPISADGVAALHHAAAAAAAKRVAQASQSAAASCGSSGAGEKAAGSGGATSTSAADASSPLTPSTSVASDGFLSDFSPPDSAADFSPAAAQRSHPGHCSGQGEALGGGGNRTAEGSGEGGVAAGDDRTADGSLASAIREAVRRFLEDDDWDGADETSQVPKQLAAAAPTNAPTPPAMPFAPGLMDTFSFTIRKASGVDLGLVATPNERGLTVVSITPGGALDSWNRLWMRATTPLAARKVVKPWDEVLRVNDVVHNGFAMLRECDSKEQLRLTVLRYSCA
eukprot:TRINITY_DN16412_c0_g1_i2.p1 TRINITY_DN16412_c0_g1~~TRINITY_DN16412_c0_g1_i2.p1  ORF type:complete len:376 (+),score=95.67 TRINITY_DN16412_c0_g1_i2:66-1193(+)